MINTLLNILNVYAKHSSFALSIITSLKDFTAPQHPVYSNTANSLCHLVWSSAMSFTDHHAPILLQQALCLPSTTHSNLHPCYNFLSSLPSTLVIFVIVSFPYSKPAAIQHDPTINEGQPSSG